MPKKITARIQKVDISGRFAPESLNAENRTVEMVFTTADPVEMFSYDLGRFREILRMDEKSVDLSRFKNGAPLLNSHRRFDLKDQIGKVESVRIEGDQLVGTVRFSKRDDVEPIFQDVKDGIITNGSIGYVVEKYKDISKDNEEIRTLEAIQWIPHEMSLVTIPADKRAGTRNHQSGRESGETYEIEIQLKGESMPDIKKTEAAPVSEPKKVEGPTVDVENQVEAERNRCTAITRACRQSKLPEKFSQELIEKGTPLDQALTKIIDAAADLAQNEPETRSFGSVRVGDERDEIETRREGAVEALLHRVAPGEHKITEKGQQFKNMGVLRMAEHFLQINGVRTSMLSKNEIASRAFHSTDDFPNILSSAMSKRLQAGYEASEQTFKLFGVETSLPDFKTHNVVQLGDAPDLEQLGEGGEVKFGTIGENLEQYNLVTYAKALSITRQVIVNDDLNAFLRLARAFGKAAADLETTTAINAVISNPTMGDGVALFHANHSNLASAAALSESELSTLKALMREQTNSQSRPMNIAPRYLMVGSEIEDTALKLLADKNQNGGFNVHGGKFELIVEPRLNATEYYIIADPSKVEGLEYAYLEGERGLQVEVERGFNIEGMKIKARLDFAAKAIDYRAFAKNAGA
jgi:phage head maturation protease